MNKDLKNLLIPPFNAERKLKAEISSFFLNDAHYFLLLSELAYSHSHEFELPSAFSVKIFVDISFSAETSLKSLIMSLSPKDESPERAYKEIRTCSHNLEKLITKVKTRAKSRLKFLNQNDIDLLKDSGELGVKVRYSLEFYLLRRNEEFHEKAFYSGKYSQWLQPEKIMQFIDVSKRLYNISSESYSRYCAKKRAYTMNNGDKYDRRLEDFLRNTRQKNKKSK